MHDTATQLCASGKDDLTDELPAGAASCLAQILPLEFSKSLIRLDPRRPMVLGRSASCDIELTDDLVSREQAVLAWNTDLICWELRDCESRNGTFVNDRQVQECVMHPGDQIRMGGYIFKFLPADHVEALYHETVYQMMTVDTLTQIYNRRYFEDGFERELQRSLRHGRPLSILMFDLDRFKLINDDLGHLVGDEVLRNVCQRVRRRVRRDELFARYGGDEFVVVLAESTAAQAEQVAEEMREIVSAQPVETSLGLTSVTISMGIAHTSGLEPVTTAELISLADKKLYEAKHAGRDCVCA